MRSQLVRPPLPLRSSANSVRASNRGMALTASIDPPAAVEQLRAYDSLHPHTAPA